MPCRRELRRREDRAADRLHHPGHPGLPADLAVGEHADSSRALDGDRVERRAVFGLPQFVAGQVAGAVPRPGIKQVRGTQQAADVLRVNGSGRGHADSP
jgi:hypothetical protein